ncbi:hypothetical protein E4U53_000735, partial [Claviceps sorghi]
SPAQRTAAHRTDPLRAGPPVPRTGHRGRAARTRHPGRRGKRPADNRPSGPRQRASQAGHRLRPARPQAQVVVPPHRRHHRHRRRPRSRSRRLSQRQQLRQAL